MPIVVKCAQWEGESTIQGYESYFEVTSFSFGVGRGISSATGTSTREGSTASVSEITLTKPTDKTSVKLFEMALCGKLDHDVEIAFVRTASGGGGVTYLKFELSGCGISGYSLSSGGDRPTESFSLNFDKVTMTYDPVGDGLTGGAMPYGWDLATGAPA